MRKWMLILLLIWVQNLTAQVEYPPFVRLEKAHLVFPGDSSALRRFHDKIEVMTEGKQHRVIILQIGGSHVQAGFLTQGIRVQLTDWLDSLTAHQAGRGDRGMLFPYHALKTNAPQDYSIQASGEWTGQRNLSKEPTHPMGLAGAYVATADSATLHIKLDSLWSFERLRIYGSTLTDSIKPILTIGQDTLQATRQDSLGWTFFTPKNTNECTLVVEATGSDTLYLRGFQPMSERKGLTYAESGINGASLPCWLRCGLLEQELGEFVPDLVIFGIGINDANCLPDKFSADTFKENYRQLINRIRRVNPDCSLVFLTNNDCFIGLTRRFNLNTLVVEDAFFQLAKEYNGAVFDTYQVMGGYRSSSKWVASKLMRRDHIHFTESGYRILADLISKSIIEDFERRHATR